MPTPSQRLTLADADVILAKALATPAEVEVDGKHVVNRSGQEINDLLNNALGGVAKASSVMSVARFSPGGSPVD